MAVRTALLPKASYEAIFGSFVCIDRGSWLEYIVSTATRWVFYTTIVPPLIHHYSVHSIESEIQTALDSGDARKRFEGIKSLSRYASFVNDLALALLIPADENVLPLEIALQDIEDLKFIASFLKKIGHSEKIILRKILIQKLVSSDHAILRESLLSIECTELLVDLLDNAPEEEQKTALIEIITSLMVSEEELKLHVQATMTTALVERLWDSLKDQQIATMTENLLTILTLEIIVKSLKTKRGRQLLEKLIDQPMSRDLTAKFATELAEAFKFEETADSEEDDDLLESVPNLIIRMLTTSDGAKLIWKVVYYLPISEQIKFLECLVDSALFEDNYVKTPLWWLLLHTDESVLRLRQPNDSVEVTFKITNGLGYALNILDMLPEGELRNDFTDGLVKALLIPDGTGKKYPLKVLLLSGENKPSSIERLTNNPDLNSALATAIMESNELGELPVVDLFKLKDGKGEHFLLQMFSRLSLNERRDFFQKCLQFLPNTPAKKVFFEKLRAI